VNVTPFDLPKVSIPAIDLIRYAETAAFFEDATRSGLLTSRKWAERSTRPTEIRSAYFTPAVEFIQANRYRTRVMQQMNEAMSGLDLFIGSQQLITNRTVTRLSASKRIPQRIADGAAFHRQDLR